MPWAVTPEQSKGTIGPVGYKLLVPWDLKCGLFDNS